MASLNQRVSPAELTGVIVSLRLSKFSNTCHTLMHAQKQKHASETKLWMGENVGGGVCLPRAVQNFGGKLPRERHFSPNWTKRRVPLFVLFIYFLKDNGKGFPVNRVQL